ncbi:MAG: hypothetical protein RI986_629 [Planctomycetota bacterium]
MNAGSNDALFWIGIVALFVLIVGGSGIVFWARRAAKSPDLGASPGFTLDDMRGMLERGEMTRREFDTARDAMVQRTRENAKKERDQRGGTDWGSEEPRRTPRR